MKIISNDKEIIQNLYQRLENNNENVHLIKSTVAGAYGYDEIIEWAMEKIKVDVKVDVKMNFTKILVTFINRYFDYKTQKLMLIKEDNTKIIIDTEIMKEGKPLENFNIEVNENDSLYIEKIEK